MNKLSLTDEFIVNELAPELLNGKTPQGYSAKTILYHKELVNEGGVSKLKLTFARLKYIGTSLVTDARNAANAALGIATEAIGKGYLVQRSSLRLAAEAIDSPLLSAVVGQEMTINGKTYEMVEICNTTGASGMPVITVENGVNRQRATLVNGTLLPVWHEFPIVPKGDLTPVTVTYSRTTLPSTETIRIGDALAAALATAEETPIAPDQV